MFQFEVHGFVVCDLAERSWAFEGRVRNAVLGLKELNYDSLAVV